jgi:hypothetical protein
VNLAQEYGSQPSEVSLETLAQCNARCTFCPYTTLERIGTRMPDALIARLIDEMATFEKPFFFSPFKVNEPLLDKRFMSICQTFLERCPKGVLRIFSNGSTLTEKALRGIAGLSRVTHLWVSLNEHRPDEYKALMGLDFEQTAKKLDRLHEMVMAGEFPHDVVVSRVGMDVYFQYYVHNRWPAFKIVLIKHDAWIDYTYAHNTAIPNTPCGRWWELSITATGKAALCCMDGKGEYGFGDVNQHTLLEIYNHPTLKAWRDGKTRIDAGKPCNGCTY